jgi:hypothetical protein
MYGWTLPLPYGEMLQSYNTTLFNSGINKPIVHPSKIKPLTHVTCITVEWVHSMKIYSAVLKYFDFYKNQQMIPCLAFELFKRYMKSIGLTGVC